MEGLRAPVFKPIENSQAQSWKEFKADFAFYLTACEKDTAADEQKIALLLYCMGKDYQRVFQNLGLTNDEKKVYKTVLEKFDSYFQPKKLTKGYITKFQQRKQHPQETVSQYIISLRDLAAHCDFGDQLETQLSVQISNGVLDERLRRKLWSEDLNLQDTINKCHQWEQLQETAPLYSSTTPSAPKVDYIRGRGRSRSRGHAGQVPGRGRGPGGRGRGPDAQGRCPSAQGRGQGSQDEGQVPGHQHPRHGPGGHHSHVRGQYRGRSQAYRGQGRGHQAHGSRCERCGTSHSYNRCPANGKECYYCHKFNHFASCCRKKNVHYVDVETVNDFDTYDTRVEAESDVQTFDEAFVFTCRTTESDQSKWHVSFNLKGGDQISMKIDTGANINAISKREYDKMVKKPQ